MIEMTAAERIVSNFLTEKKFKYEFQPIVSVKDMRDMPKIKKLAKEIEKLNNILEETINTYLGEWKKDFKIFYEIKYWLDKNDKEMFKLLGL